MPAVTNALVIGAGLAGSAATILLADGGVAVDLVELQPDVTALGSGITLQGNALRVLRQLGVWPGVEKHGYAFDSLGLRAPDPAGTLVAEIPDVATGGPDLPATLGIDRPTLAALLMDRVTGLGATVRSGLTVSSLADSSAGVDVTFSDGTTGRYDVVIGADGLRSHTRELLGVQLQTRSLGMGIWRAFAPRPASVTRTDLYYGGPSYIAGYTPTGPDSLYAYIVEPAQDRHGLSPEQKLAVMRELSQAYHGPWDDVRAVLTDPARVNYTFFETHLLDPPWNRGRVVLIGDAAHTCPPTIAQGGAMALEDAAVLAELLLGHDTLDGALWDAFMDRRFARAELVVESSNQLAQWQLDHVQGDVAALMGRVVGLVAQPA